MTIYVFIKFVVDGECKWEAIPEQWTDFHNNTFYWPTCGKVTVHLAQEATQSIVDHFYSQMNTDKKCKWERTEIKSHSQRFFGKVKNNSELLVALRAEFDKLEEEGKSIIKELNWCYDTTYPRLRNTLPIKTWQKFLEFDNELKNTCWDNMSFDNLMKTLTIDEDHLKESITKILFAVFSCDLDYNNQEKKYKEEFTQSRLFEKLKQHINTLDPNFKTEKTITDVFESRVLVKKRIYSAL
ncbi:uncharacterized protein LOC130663764 isoform X2 [Microplitis mediator]|uniref:uncharacterized protein LOC130663713 isoform X2 n=1 Tax=Microplitis mediator TaxID=375433 RepID=UPI002554CB43|nr:uncharacterized protein LOC130663713 isoform X2 [Microplitis mediator]XP_057319187.1 uncharacterized protein LOC130663764 isoform X2 [Microplitis mediator]